MQTKVPGNRAVLAWDWSWRKGREWEEITKGTKKPWGVITMFIVLIVVSFRGVYYLETYHI